MRKTNSRKIAKWLALSAVLAVAALFVMAYFDLPTKVQDFTNNEWPRLYRKLRPIRIDDAEVLRELKGSSVWAAAQAATEEDFWEDYRLYRAEHRAGALVPLNTAVRLTDSLKAAYPEVAAEIVELANRYRNGQLGTFERWDDRLGRDFTWTTYPAVDDDLLFVWEANTLQHLPILAQAFLLTGDTTYVQAIATQLESWNAENPVEVSDNWLAQMEVSLRMASLLWTSDLLVESVAAQHAFPELTRQILSHARFIARKIDDPRRRNNHGLFTAIGLFLVGEAYPEFAASGSWRSFGEARVLEEIGLQYSNGAHIERAPTYQKALFDGLVQMLSAYRRQNRAAPAALDSSLRAQRRVLAIMSGPDGRVARFSDSDDHRYVVLAPRPYTDGAGSIQVYEMSSGIGLTSLPTCMAAWEAAWLRAGFERVTCTESVERALHKTAVADTAVGFTKIALGPWTLIADFAAYGGHADFSGHSHADIGTFELWHEQREVVIDPGTYTYRRAGKADEFPWRIYFRSSPAHNVVLPNGAGQSVPYGEFGLRTWQDASVTTLWSAANVAIVAGRHVIYDSITGPSARLFIVQPEGVTVVDWFPKARSQVTYDLRVHTAASKAEVEGTAVTIGEGFRLQFAARAGAPIKTDIAVGGKPFEGGWRSRHYGDLEEIATARVQSPQSGPAAVVTRIIAGASAESPAVRSDGTTIEVALLGGGWLRLDDCAASDPKQQPRPCAPTVTR